jgi:ABC-type transporter Mla subunit MlaD
MASLKERTRNNVRAGIFVSVSILVAVSSIIVLTDAWRALFQPTHEYTVIYDVSDGVQNLKSGADVLIGGMLMGEVAEVAARTDQRAFEQIEVTLAISRDIQLYEGAEIAIGSAIIGDNAWIEVSSVGNPDLGEPHDRQFTGISAPILGGLLGAVSADDTEAMVADFQGAARNVRELTERVNTQDWPRWADRVDVVTEWAAKAAGDFDAVFQDGRDLLAEYKNLVAENRPSIDAAIENIKVGTGDAKEVARRVREETVDKVHNLLDTGQAGMDTATAAQAVCDRAPPQPVEAALPAPARGVRARAALRGDAVVRHGGQRSQGGLGVSAADYGRSRRRHPARRADAEAGQRHAPRRDRAVPGITGAPRDRALYGVRRRVMPPSSRGRSTCRSAAPPAGERPGHFVDGPTYRYISTRGAGDGTVTTGAGCSWTSRASNRSILAPRALSVSSIRA